MTVVDVLSDHVDVQECLLNECFHALQVVSFSFLSNVFVRNSPSMSCTNAMES